MSEPERKFKINKRTSYEDALKEATGATTLGTFALGACAVLTVATAAKFAENPVLSENLTSFLTMAASAGLTALDIRYLIESIIEKTILKHKIADINDELELDDEIKVAEGIDRAIEEKRAETNARLAANHGMEIMDQGSTGRGAR